MLSVVFIGAGSLATSLAVALHEKGHAMRQVYSRTQESAQLLASRLGDVPTTTSLNEIIPDADLYVYAVTDDALAKIAGKIQVREQAIQVHTSGATPLSVFPKEINAGVFYPFQSFVRTRLVDFSTVPILLEATNAETMQTLHAIASELSTTVYEASSDSRLQLHLAGVLANNFPNYLYSLAEQHLKKAGLPFSLLFPSIEETVKKIHTMRPCDAQSGPAKRGDEKTINKHLSIIDGEDEHRMYELLTEMIRRS